MTIKKGVIRHRTDFGNESYIEQVATVIEKTQGEYSEILFCKDKDEYVENGVILSGGYGENVFTVYHGKTIEAIIAANGIYNYEWTTPLAEV